jgi:hypothetical protein
MNPIARLVLLVAALFATGAAQANCKPLLAAAEKMVQQSRFAAYEVDKPEQPPGAEPDTVIIGKVAYVRDGKAWERIELTEFGDLVTQQMQKLRKEIAAGELRCAAAGSGSFRGAPVAKFKYENVDGSREPNTGTVWIDTRSGLPVYEGNADGGFFLVYGNAVKEPIARK